MNIFADSKSIISDIINRIMNCRGLKILYIGQKCGIELDDLYPEIEIRNIEKYDRIEDGIVYFRTDDLKELERLETWIYEQKADNDYIIYFSNEDISLCKGVDEFPVVYPLNRISAFQGYLFLKGKTFDDIAGCLVPESFRVLAIMHFYNEVDILEQTIRYLLSQEADIYLIDNWSDDGGYELAKRYQIEVPDRIYLERFPECGKSNYYEWYKQLEKTEEISKKMDYDWFLHYDTDEMRMSPWKDTTLRKAIYYIDKQGYNCIENTVIDFKLTEQENKDHNIFMEDTFFDFRHRKLWFDQVKTWKKSTTIELKSSGGHFARIENPKIYPLKILNRHYPLRSIEQAQKKVFYDRLPRFKKEREERGWHGHYDKIRSERDLLSDSQELLFWNKNTFNELYIPLFLECGLRWDNQKGLTKIDLPQIENKRIIVYGAGRIGRRVYLDLVRKNSVVGWVDTYYDQLPMIFCREIISPKEIENILFDFIIIAIRQVSIQQEVLILLKDMGVQMEKIILC